jgi:hypothetical protein
MFTATVTHEDIINQEGVLDSYLREQLDWNTKIENAKVFVRQELKNSSKQLKKLCVPLYFKNEDDETSLSSSGSFESEITSQDLVERLRFCVNASSVTDNVTFTLYGSNDETTFVQVKGIKPDGTVINNIVLTQNGEDSFVVQKAYDYYYIWVSGTASFEAYMVETTFELPVLYKAIEYIYKDLQGEPGSNFDAKAEFYAGMYNDAFNTALYSYDKDLSGDIEDTEQDNNMQVLRYYR